jgi:hypothetical protein
MSDPDFKERMYAKQIAVMKGQAWNVVETLKTEGHGPLELTRRARVHVWDDLVDVPTVVPLGRTSVEHSSRRVRRERQQQEEMDISAAGASAPERASQDLLGPTSPKKEVQSPFNVSRQNSSMDVRPGNKASDPNTATFDFENNGPLSPTNLESFTAHHSPERKKPSRHSHSYHSPSASTSNKRPQVTAHSRSRMSFEFPRSQPSGGRSRRRYSLGVWDDGEDDGDLGFAATEEREANRVQVVVERLETVKGKNPFFTWC